MYTKRDLEELFDLMGFGTAIIANGNRSKLQQELLDAVLAKQKEKHPKLKEQNTEELTQSIKNEDYNTVRRISDNPYWLSSEKIVGIQWQINSRFFDDSEVHEIALPFIKPDEIKVAPNEHDKIITVTVSVKEDENRPFSKGGERLIHLTKSSDIKASFKDSVLTLTCTYKKPKESTILINIE